MQRHTQIGVDSASCGLFRWACRLRNRNTSGTSRGWYPLFVRLNRACASVIGKPRTAILAPCGQFDWRSYLRDISMAISCNNPHLQLVGGCRVSSRPGLATMVLASLRHHNGDDCVAELQVFRKADAAEDQECHGNAPVKGEHKRALIG